MKLLALTFLTLALSAVHAETETKTFDLAGIKKIAVRNSAGDVKISEATDNKAVVAIDKEKTDATCKIKTEKDGDTLVVQMRDTGITGLCKVNFEIMAPKNCELDLAIGKGSFTGKGVFGDLTFKVGHGTVSVDGEIKEIEGKSGNGEINLSGLTSGGSLKAGNGKINLVYKTVPDSGELEIKSANGGAVITLPGDSKFHTSFISANGKLTNEVGDTSGSKFKISMKSAHGDLDIIRAKR